jgi:hypothetical protein
MPYLRVMKIDEGMIAEALRVKFDSRSLPGFFANDAREVLGMIRGKESRMAIMQKLANVQMRVCNTVTHDACARLADKLLEADGHASRPWGGGRIRH